MREAALQFKRLFQQQPSRVEALAREFQFADGPQARLVCNDALCGMDTPQGHFGRPGLRMPECDPRQEGMLHAFDDEAREVARIELPDSIPRLLS